MSTMSNFNLLTMKQKKVYSVIESYIKENKIPPTVREIGELVGEKTPGAVQGILNRLEQKGMIKRQVGMARSIQLVAEDSMLYETPVYLPEIKKINNRNIDDFLGMYNIYKYHPLSPDLLNGSKNCFLMGCSDNSLTESGFGSGDMLLVSIDAEIKDKDVVLVLYDNRIFLRYYYTGKQPDTVILKADTDLIGKEVFKISEIQIVGKVIGKHTRY